MSERIDSLADALVDAGIGALFGVPGSGLSWELLTALEDRGVPFQGMAHEGSAAMAAGAYSCHAERIGASLSIKGPGLANMLPGLLSSLYEQWPVISIAEAYGPGRGARVHKYLDQAQATRAFAKAYARLGDPAGTIARLAAAALAEAPGPVHLDLCAEDAPAWDAREVLAPAAAAAVADERDAVDAIAASARPVVIAGAFAERAGWRQRLAALRVPVFTTVSAKGLVDERQPYAAGVYTGDGKRLAPERAVVQEADTIVLLGVRALELLGVQPFARPTFLVDAIDGGLAATGARSLPATAAGAVLDALETHAWGADLVADSLRRMREELLAPAWLPARLIDALEHRVGGDGGLVVDTGSFCTIAEHIWRAREPWQFTASANGRFMGTGIPMAIGSICAHRRPTVCVVGDGGMRVGSADLKLVAAQRWPMLIVLMRDGRYSSIAAGRGSRRLHDEAVTIPNPGWAAAVEAFGWPVAEVHDVGGFEDALASWQPAAGPLFVEAVFDPAPYESMARELR